MPRYLYAYVTLLLIGWEAHAADSPYLFVWAADADMHDSDFVAVIDSDPQSPAYGDVLATVEVGVAAEAHHSEHRMPEGGRLFVNGFATGHSFVADLSDPLEPAVVAHFTEVGEYSHAHSFERLPNGNVLATFQNGLGGRSTTGGLVEFTPEGQMLRSASAAVPEFPEVRPYSLAIYPTQNRVVTTTTDMWGEVLTADSVQFWHMSDLSLLDTVRLPAGPRGDEHRLPAEPRLVANERMMVNTFRCGLYQIHNLASDSPRITHVYTFALGNPTDFEQLCALAVTFDRFWIQTVPSRNGLVALNLGDVENPAQAGYVNLGEGRRPHWISLEPNNERIVVTGFGEMLNSLTMVNVDPSTGELSVDVDFGDGGVVDFGRTVWPHGSTGTAIPHGSVFSNP